MTSPSEAGRTIAGRAASADPATVIAAGVLAAILAAICHETLGHGLGCVIDGGRITLLTSIWFRCAGAMSITDAGGPVGSLIGGVAALTFLSVRAPGSVLRLVILMFGGFSLFWFAGQLITQPLFNRDDFFFVAHRMGWSWVWRPVMGTIGVVAYAAAMRWVVAVLRWQRAPGWHAIRLSYVAGVVSAVVAGLMWQVEPVRSAIEGFQTLGIVPLGLLVAARRGSRDGVGDVAPVPRSWAWIVGCAVVFGLFLFVQSRGLGSLAGAGFVR
ncbi:hypothetical protein [Acidisphaera sp. S103]|uniref:hypothetical protein n=1 Tax=Acidisphaera sp. S103 TaxID=1747223 RepID=UPI00131E4AAD|nr:hypothetical protein [Acidisphaera sp. S103]